MVIFDRGINFWSALTILSLSIIFDLGRSFLILVSDFQILSNIFYRFGQFSILLAIFDQKLPLVKNGHDFHFVQYQ